MMYSGYNCKPKWIRWLCGGCQLMDAMEVVDGIGWPAPPLAPPIPDAGEGR